MKSYASLTIFKKKNNNYFHEVETLKNFFIKKKL